MSRTFAYVCNDRNLSPSALDLFRSHVQMGDPGESSGFGFGWFQGKQRLLRTIPRPNPGTSAFLDLMADLPTKAAIGQLRDPEEPFADVADLQPFRFRDWIFAHAGEEPTEERFAELATTIPGFLAGKRRGSSFGELVGHVFFGQLHRRNLLDGRHKPMLLASAMADAVRVVMERGPLAGFGLLALRNQTLLVARSGRTMHFGEIRGITVEKEPPLFAGHKPKTAEHPRFKALAVTDAPLTREAGDWREIPDQHVLWVDHEWRVGLEPI